MKKTNSAHLCEDVDVVGINNRNLKTFTVDLNRSIRLADRLTIQYNYVLPKAVSGISKPYCYMKAAGFNGFLIGEQFMKEPDPAIAFASFVDQLKTKLYESKSLRNDATRSGKEA